MLTREDNDLLTRTGAATPMGEYFRRFWQPVCLSEEVPEPDGPPVRVRIMGEDLIAFRDSEGQVGLVDSRCPHRGADLYFGRNEECGIRCVYHGWKFDRTGRAVDMPNVPPRSPYKDKVRLKSYPTREYGEIVWAWLGPPDNVPDVPELEHGVLPATHRFVSKKLQECNWAQTMEGALDTSHFSFLHMPAPHVPSPVHDDIPADEKRLNWIRHDPMPRFSILEHEVGFVIGGARRADGQDIYWRTTQFMLPSHATTPSTLPGETYFGYTFVPIDDESCWIYTYAWNPDRPIGDAERAKLRGGHGVFGEIGADYVPLRNRRNNYEIDRTTQKNQSYTGVRGLAEQDAMIQESQGRIVDRTMENLTATDAAIVRFRRWVMNGAKALADGSEPDAPRHPELYRRRSGSWIADQGISFEDVMKERFGDVRGKV